MSRKVYGLVQATHVHRTNDAVLLEFSSGVRRWIPWSTVRKITVAQVPLGTEVEIETWVLDKQSPPIKYKTMEH